MKFREPKNQTWRLQTRTCRVGVQIPSDRWQDTATCCPSVMSKTHMDIFCSDHAALITHSGLMLVSNWRDANIIWHLHLKPPIKPGSVGNSSKGLLPNTALSIMLKTPCDKIIHNFARKYLSRARRCWLAKMWWTARTPCAFCASLKHDPQSTGTEHRMPVTPRVKLYG